MTKNIYEAIGCGVGFFSGASLGLIASQFIASETVVITFYAIGAIAGTLIGGKLGGILFVRRNQESIAPHESDESE
jgi:outer membrane lipoprotein SlyB